LQTKTEPTKSTQIGVRKAPAPEGRPGFIRIDSVHQGDLDGIKGLYHINAVDCVTQWQVVASVQTISEAHLLSVIEEMLRQFPFEILGFHADNGSEYVNHKVARMLEKLRIEFTRSRPRHSNDKDYVSYCTSFAPSDKSFASRRRSVSLAPSVLRGASSPGGSYNDSFLSL